MGNNEAIESVEVLMPRLGVNDDSAIVTKQLIKDGGWVDNGKKIAVIETSKETSEVVAEKSGILHWVVLEGDEVSVGKAIAIIGYGMKSEIEDRPHKGLRMTEKAKKLVEDNDIDVFLLPEDKLIREKDVLPFIQQPFHIEETKQNELLLYGGGGFSEIAIDILRVTHAYNSYGIIDMGYPNVASVMGVPVIAGDDGLQEYFDKGYRKIFNGIGVTRKTAYEKLKPYGFEFPNIIHAKAIMELSVSLGEGNLICAGAIIGAQAKIGNDCVINAGAIVSHDCIISDHCHVASGAVLAGIITVGENTLIGQNVTIYSRVKIGSNVVIENGCSVFKDVPSGSVVRYKA